MLHGVIFPAEHAPRRETRLTALGLSPVGICGADFGAHLRKKNEEYGRIIREANIEAE